MDRDLSDALTAPMPIVAHETITDVACGGGITARSWRAATSNCGEVGAGWLWAWSRSTSCAGCSGWTARHGNRSDLSVSRDQRVGVERRDGDGDCPVAPNRSVYGAS